MADNTINHPHLEERHMTDVLNNLTNAVTSDASNLTNLTLTNTKMAEKLKVALTQNKVLTELLSKTLWGVTATHSENQYKNK